ncbi:MAG: hypothetical protein ACLTZY_14785 [Alistipes indistinctus]
MLPLEAGGNVNVTDLQYDKRRIGTIGLGFDYRMEKGSGQQFDAKLSLDSTEVLSARGSYTDTLPERPLELKVELPGLPLTPVNALLTPGMAQLSGASEREDRRNRLLPEFIGRRHASRFCGNSRGSGYDRDYVPRCRPARSRSTTVSSGSATSRLSHRTRSR